jgi:hypothetical protein
VTALQSRMSYGSAPASKQVGSRPGQDGAASVALVALIDGFCGAEEMVVPRSGEMSSDTGAAGEPLLGDPQDADESAVFAPVDTFGLAGLAAPCLPAAKPLEAAGGDGSSVVPMGGTPVDTAEAANAPQVRR